MLREYRSFPNLIFAMESFEESVLKVAKKSKVQIELVIFCAYWVDNLKLIMYNMTDTKNYYHRLGNLVFFFDN